MPKQTFLYHPEYDFYMSKIKGTAAEREVVHRLWAEGWAAIRVAGSGSVKYPAPDILAGNNLRKIAIECKATKSNKQYLTKKEVGELKTFSVKFGAEPWIGVRFDRDAWYFINPEDLKETKENYVITSKEAKMKGLLFDEFLR